MDIAGFPCDYDSIMQLVNAPEIREMFKAESAAQEKLGRILVMNDAAHSLGAYYSKTSVPVVKRTLQFSLFMP